MNANTDKANIFAKEPTEFNIQCIQQFVHKPYGMEKFEVKKKCGKSKWEDQ